MKIRELLKSNSLFLCLLIVSFDSENVYFSQRSKFPEDETGVVEDDIGVQDTEFGLTTITVPCETVGLPAHEINGGIHLQVLKEIRETGEGLRLQSLHDEAFTVLET